MANITVDITTLSNYSAISLGSHQLTVVAKAPGFLDSNPSTAVTFVNGYELVFDTISNCTYTPSPSMISAFDSTTITFTPDAHYVLPDSIYVGGTADHTWDKSTGRLVLSNVKSNITLECEATLETFPVTISATGCTYSPTGWTEVAYGEGGEIWLQNVNSGYRLPDSVTVTGASYEYNKDSGFIRISNATGPVTVTITCVQIYTITANITNGSWSGDTQVDVGASAMGVIMPNSGYSYPTTVSATNATVNYSSIDGSLILADITGNVVITAECLVQLAAPANVSADGTTVSWDEVENATSYEVRADGESIGTVEQQIVGYNVSVSNVSQHSMRAAFNVGFGYDDGNNISYVGFPKYISSNSSSDIISINTADYANSQGVAPNIIVVGLHAVIIAGIENVGTSGGVSFVSMGNATDYESGSGYNDFGYGQMCIYKIEGDGTISFNGWDDD